MKDEDIIIGERYVPHSKSIATPFNHPGNNYKTALERGQPYLYCLSKNKDRRGGFWFSIKKDGCYARPESSLYAARDVSPFEYKPDYTFLKDIWLISTEEERRVLEDKYPLLK